MTSLEIDADVSEIHVEEAIAYIGSDEGLHIVDVGTRPFTDRPESRNRIGTSDSRLKRERPDDCVPDASGNHRRSE